MSETSFLEDSENYPSSPSAYTLHALLGSGSTCKVFRASVDLPNYPGVAVAVKIMDLSENDDWDLVFKEVTLMRTMKHENLVNILTSFTHGEQLWVIMPLLQAGSVRSIMLTLAFKGFVNESIISCILAGALNGLAYMHNHNYIHRDVKAGNILLSASGVPKLADFGVAATTSSNPYAHGSKKAHTFTGTPCWMAPEVIAQDQEGYGTAADIWSLGITALELAFGYPPYAKMLPLKAMMATMDSDPPTPESYADPARCQAISKEFRRFIARALQKDPHRRPTALELLQDPFIKKAPKYDFLRDNLVSKLPLTHLDGNIGNDVVISQNEIKLSNNSQDDSSRGVHCSGFSFDTIKHAQREQTAQEIANNQQNKDLHEHLGDMSSNAQSSQQNQKPLTSPTSYQQEANPADQQTQQQHMTSSENTPENINMSLIQQSQKAMILIQKQLFQLASRVSSTQKPEELQVLQQQINMLQQQLQIHQKNIQTHLQIAQQQQK